MSVEEKIKNVEILIKEFGKFPTFHDSEVSQIVLDRGDRKTNTPPSLLARIHLMKVVDKDAKTGELFWGEHLVTMRFSDVEDLDLLGLNQQNVLFDLLINELPETALNKPKFEILFESSYGGGAEFKCSEIVVESLEPLELHEKEVVDEKTKQERAEFFRKMLLEKKNRRSSDQQAIAQLRDDWKAAIDMKDIRRILSLVTENCVFLAAYQPPIKGKPALEALYKLVFEKYEIKQNFIYEEIKILYDWAYAWGYGEMTMTPLVEGEPIHSKGYGLMVLHREEEGEWKFARGISNLTLHDNKDSI
jgi:uncharacterized protein (TIGR02246 family)